MKIKSLWNWKWSLRSCSNHYKRNDIFNCSEWPRYSLHFKAKKNKGWTNCDKLLAMFRLVPKLSKARNMPGMYIWVKFSSQHCPPFYHLSKTKCHFSFHCSATKTISYSLWQWKAWVNDLDVFHLLFQSLEFNDW